ncbi:hypothetical protein ACFWP2_27440 [Kitasatospora sp. NPDC058444]|uniref:hypothetical protein n=1 Tax=Kitasatospora sp. NPDC058444 TaxID=3346504 RepID=UPI00365A7D62
MTRGRHRRTCNRCGAEAPRFYDHESRQNWCADCLAKTLLVGRCYWCKRAEPTIRDLDTGYAWCTGCATDTVLKGDPIDHYEELTPEGAEYTRLLLSKGQRRTNPGDED